MNNIDHYCILAKKNYSDGYYFVTGYKTLPTLRKKFQSLKDMISNLKHDEIIIVARDYDKNIVKVYDRY